MVTGKNNASKEPLRIALIGAGNRTSGPHYASLTKIQGVRLVAIADRDSHSLNLTAEKLGIQSRYADYAKMLEQEKPDMAYLISVPHQAYDAAATVLESGCHLIHKEPPGITSEQTRQLVQLAESHGVLTGVPFHRRFSPVIRCGKTLCEVRGQIHSAVATFYKHSTSGKPYYLGGTDMLTCDAIHAVDTVRYLCGGEVESVASDVRRKNADYRNIHLALIRFSSGATGVVLTNWLAGRRMFTAEAHAPGISFFGDPEEGGCIFADGNTVPVQQLDVGEEQDHHFVYGIREVHEHIIDSFRLGCEPETSFQDVLKTMQLLDDIRDSQI